MTVPETTKRRIPPEELRGLFLFEHLDDEQLSWVCEHSDVVDVPAGEDLVVEGNPAECFYVLLRGALVMSRQVGAEQVEINRTDYRGSYVGAVQFYLGDQTDPGILQRIIEEQGAPLVVIDDGSHIPAHVRESFRILFPLLPDGAVYCIEDTQTSYWPAWGGELEPRAAGTSMDLVKDLIDGLNHEEFLL